MSDTAVGFTPLSIAGARGHTAVAQALREAGATTAAP